MIDNKLDDIPYFTVEDTSWSKIPKVIIYFLIGLFIFANIILPYLTLYVFPSLFDGSIDISFLVGVITVMNIPIFVFIIKIISLILPFQKTKVCILETELNIYLQNSLYSKIILNELETIELIKISKYNIALNFKKSNSEKKLLIILFLFKKKKQEVFVNCLKQVSKKLNINFLESKVKTYDSHEINEISKSIKNFIKIKKKK